MALHSQIANMLQLLILSLCSAESREGTTPKCFATNGHCRAGNQENGCDSVGVVIGCTTANPELSVGTQRYSRGVPHTRSWAHKIPLSDNYCSSITQHNAAHAEWKYREKLKSYHFFILPRRKTLTQLREKHHFVWSPNAAQDTCSYSQ